MATNVCFKNAFVRNLLNERMFEFSDICPSATFDVWSDLNFFFHKYKNIAHFTHYTQYAHYTHLLLVYTAKASGTEENSSKVAISMECTNTVSHNSTINLATKSYPCAYTDGSQHGYI